MPSPVDAVLGALSALIAGDVEAARPFVADDFVWHFPGESVVGGDVTGVDAWAAKLRRLVAAGLRPQLETVLDDGEHVAVVQRNVASSGDATLDVRVVNLFRVSGGKVARMDTFPGDQRAIERFWDEVLRD